MAIECARSPREVIGVVSPADCGGEVDVLPSLRAKAKEADSLRGNEESHEFQHRGLARSRGTDQGQAVIGKDCELVTEETEAGLAVPSNDKRVADDHALSGL